VADALSDGVFAQVETANRPDQAALFELLGN